MNKWLLLTGSHALVLGLGFLLGVYFLPILAAPPAPTQAEILSHAQAAQYTARFQRDLPGSDLLHWGEGELAIGPHGVSLRGRLAPGPAYRLYLTPEAVNTAADFQRIQASSLPVGDIKTFDNFMLAMPPGVDLMAYRGVVVWCESFQRFITSARYR